MLAALVLATMIHVSSGDTMSGLAASNSVSLSALEAANPQVSDPNIIVVGESLNVPGAGGNSISGDSSSQPSTSLSQSGASSVSPTSSSTGSSPSSLSSVPGVPASFAACVAFRESTNGTNPAANGNVYGIIPASGYNVAGMSLDQQKQVFSQLYAQYGSQPWSPSDHC